MWIKNRHSIPRARNRKPPKPEPPPEVTDPLALIAASRSKERSELFAMRLQLDKLTLDMQRRIQASRAKFHLARWKMINKAMDD